MKKILTALVLASASMVSWAAAPVVSGLSNGDTFAQYSGNIVGSDDMPTGSLYWMFEGSLNGFDSYLVMFDPIKNHHNNYTNTKVKATITFDSVVNSVYKTKAALIATSMYQKAGVTYDWKNASGLEAGNTLTVSGNSITLNWTATSPGDYVRVLTVTAVPEPEGYAMLLAGLGLMGVIARRKTK